LPQTDKNRTASISPQRRKERGDYSFFSLPLTPVKYAIAFNGAGTPAKKNVHALR